MLQLLLLQYWRWREQLILVIRQHQQLLILERKLITVGPKNCSLIWKQWSKRNHAKDDQRRKCDCVWRIDRSMSLFIHDSPLEAAGISPLFSQPFLLSFIHSFIVSFFFEYVWPTGTDPTKANQDHPPRRETTFTVHHAGASKQETGERK
jgi:hypothetical protein